ncbi:hypothetical protein KP004_12825 [Geomonas oryzisoli]|uniref:Uncharacterized protein n=1 Tax=Geomonas oryzisoli TaxID=2847992 RepID=A0ABX8J1F2_9BACT|nr:hypothetical protein [Geomonas oryzisoli]QWV92104.1 hypothetical protein KP004_12825 [Geomonas oryzisoli]
MIEIKLAETFKNRFAERDLAFQKAMQKVFEEMNTRGILASGATAVRVQEVVQEEMKASGDESLRVLKDVYPVYGRNTKTATVKLKTEGLLKLRLKEIEAYKMLRLQQMLGDVASRRVLDAVDSQDQISRVEAEFELQADKFFHEMEQAKGKNLKDRIINSFYDRPVIAAIAIIIAVVVAICGFVVVVQNFKIGEGIIGK